MSHELVFLFDNLCFFFIFHHLFSSFQTCFLVCLPPIWFLLFHFLCIHHWCWWSFISLDLDLLLGRTMCLKFGDQKQCLVEWPKVIECNSCALFKVMELDDEGLRSSCENVAICFWQVGALVMKDSQHFSKDNDKFLNMMEVSFRQYDVVKCKTRTIKFALLRNLLTTPFSFKVLISIFLVLFFL